MCFLYFRAFGAKASVWKRFSTILYLAVLGCTWLFQAVIGFTWLYQTVLGLTGLYLAVPGFTWLYQTALGCTWMYLSVPGLVSLGQSWSVLVSLGQSWSVLVSPHLVWSELNSLAQFWTLKPICRRMDWIGISPDRSISRSPGGDKNIIPVSDLATCEATIRRWSIKRWRGGIFNS